MTKLIDADKLREQAQDWIDEFYPDEDAVPTIYQTGSAFAYGRIISYIDKEPDHSPKIEGLEEAAEKFAHFYDSGTCDGIAQDCFKAGANWQMANAIRKEIERRHNYDKSN